MQEQQTVHRLIEKINKALPEIKIRSITSIHTKITMGILDVDHLPRFKQLPGVLLTWINDNSVRNQNLFKVLTILSYFTKTEDGLVLLQQYAATQFFKELRMFLMSQSQKPDQYINILQQMIKALLPLQPQTKADNQEQQPPISQQEEQQRAVQPKPKQQKSVKKQQPSVIKQSSQSLTLSWKVVRDVLGKKQQDQLYSLFMQLRHGKRELHLQWLKRIHDIVKYWGYKWFRFRADLVNQLIELFPISKLKWMIIEIIRSILRGLNINNQQLQSGQSDLVKLTSNKPSSKPEVDSQKITLYGQLFNSIYSAPLLSDLLEVAISQEQKQGVLMWITQLRFKYTPNYFLTSLQVLTKSEKKQLNISLLNSQIEYYSKKFPNCKSKILEIIHNIPGDWELKPEDFPSLLTFLFQAQKNNSYRYLARYQGGWCLGVNLHIINEVINNLALGVKGVSQLGKKRELIKLYVDSLLTIAVAVEKQDPFMTFYPKLQQFIIQICQNNQCRSQLFEEILTAINSHSPIKYASKSFISSDLATMVFSQQNFYHKLFKEALYDEQSITCWLAITKRLVLSNGFENLDKYSTILYCLQYHKNQQIKELSKYLAQKLGKTGKTKILLCRLFSRSEEQKIKMTTDLFKKNSKNVFQALKTAPNIGQLSSNRKKPLKIGAETILNYFKIIFGNTLEQEIKINAAQQLLESIQRIELKQQLFSSLAMLAQNIVKLLETSYVSQKLCSLFVQIHYLVSWRVNNEIKFNLSKVVEILQNQSDLKTIQILLSYIYSECFQSPFNNEPEVHFVGLLYPHLNYLKLNVSESYIQKQVQNAPENEQNAQFLSLPDYKQSKEIEHACEYVIFRVINNEKVSLDEAFIGIVEQQIGDAIHAAKGYASLHYLHYVFTFIKENQIIIPDQIVDYTAPLLTNILTKQIPVIHAEPVSQLLDLIGVKRTKQLNNLISNGSYGTWKLFLVQKIKNIDCSILQNILKGLLGVHEGRQGALILKSTLQHLKLTQVNLFSKSMIVSSCIKFIRQDNDYMLRKIAFCCLTEIYGTCNLAADGDSELFASVASLLTEQVIQSEIMVLAVNLIKKIIEKDERVMQQVSVLKMLLSKFINLLTFRATYDLLQATILDLFRVIISFGRADLFGGADITDLALPFLSIIDRKNDLSGNNVELLVSTLDLLYFTCYMQQDLPKYLLTSTSLLNQLLTALQSRFQDDKAQYLQSLSRIWHKLAACQEDLFVYKLSQIVSKAGLSLIEVIASHLQVGKQEYLKMLSWNIVIWSKNRQNIADQVGQKIATKILQSSKPHLIKLILPFSLKAKSIFVNSSYMDSAIKAATHVIENRLVKDVKQKKKKNKVFSLDNQELQIIQHFFGLLSALFYWNGEGKVQSCEAIKKGINLLEKFYLAGVWQESIMKYFLRVTTNMSITVPLSDNIAASLSQTVSFIEEIVTAIVKCESLDVNSKFALRLASSLANIETVRSQLLRSKVIDQLSNRLIRDQQTGQLNLQYTTETLQLFLTFSIYKDTNSKILVDKRLLELFIRLLQLGRLSFLQQKIVRLMANLACFKHNKPTFMSCKDIHKTILGLLEDPQISYKSLLLSLLYNLMYKNSAALKLYRIPDVIKLIRTFEYEQNGKLLLQVLEGDQ